MKLEDGYWGYIEPGFNSMGRTKWGIENGVREGKATLCDCFSRIRVCSYIYVLPPNIIFKHSVNANSDLKIFQTMLIGHSINKQHTRGFSFLLLDISHKVN